MDLHPTPFPGKKRPSKQTNNGKTTDSSKTITKEPQISRQKRVFGTARSTNIPTKTITEKPIIKIPFGVPQKQPKPPQLTQTSTTTTTTNVATNPTTESSKQGSPEKPKPKLKKKSVCFQKQSSQNQDNALQEERVIVPKTPVAASPSLNKSKIVGTPYHTAENCSKCRFDRLETASYWLGQIKLAESVGKHFVSAAFFRLAFESKAEPIRNLRIQLKRYMARHGYLSAQTEWRDCSLTYGLLPLEDEKNAKGKNLGTGEAGTSETTCGDIDQDQKELKEQSLEQLKT